MIMTVPIFSLLVGVYSLLVSYTTLIALSDTGTRTKLQLNQYNRPPVWPGGPAPGTPFPTLGIGASPRFRDLAGRFCSILNMARLVPKIQTPCQNWWWGSQNPIDKKKKKVITLRIIYRHIDIIKQHQAPWLQSDHSLNTIIGVLIYGSVTWRIGAFVDALVPGVI